MMFEQRNILITGASGGLGRAIAQAFWERGANVWLAARTARNLETVSDDLRGRAAAGQEARCSTVDLAQPGAAAGLISELKRHWGHLDAVVNNAAILGPIGPVTENDWSEWQAAIQVNLLAPVDLCRLTVPWMRERGGGNIVNISGGGATAPRAFFSAYGTAKAGLVRFSETLARETAAFGIRVNCVAPGAMNTHMTEAVLRAGPALAGADEFERAGRQAAAGGAPPETAAELVCFLCSPAAAGVSGRLISAVWDPWKDLPSHAEILGPSDIYTLRRIVPEDRGRKWS